ncbi:MAG: hypothetical protein KAT17_07005 [Candidatus Aminicenantes bacterium]|nr:hypothetical protein [Candidatus Aminicenantes bacterium]
MGNNFSFAQEEDVLLKARQMIQKGNFDEALKELNRVIETLKASVTQKKNVAEAFYLLAKIYYIVGMETQFQDYVKKVYRVYPDFKIDESNLYLKERVGKIKKEVGVNYLDSKETRVVKENAVLRLRPEDDSQIIKKLPIESVVDVEYVNDGWVKIKYDFKNEIIIYGYIKRHFLEIGRQFPELIDIKDVIISLARTRCYGTCPVYELKIYGNGKVVYRGEKFVKTVGTKTINISEEKVRQLISEFKKAKYFSFYANYKDMHVTCMPSAITYININGVAKSIRHYHGDENAPRELRELENKIDEIVNSDQWIK